MKTNYDNLKFAGLIATLLVIIAVVLQMRNIQEGYANAKCMENGYKLAFPDKINSAGILEPDAKNPFMSYNGIPDGRLTPMTMDNNTRTMLNHILGQILNQMNNKTGAKYFLRKIDSVNITSEKQGAVTGADVDRVIKKRITVDFFAHELTKQETRRFIVVFTTDRERNIDVEHINLSNAFKLDYGKKGCIMGMPSVDGLIHTDKALHPHTKNDNICGIDETTMDYLHLSESDKMANKGVVPGVSSPTEVGTQVFLPNAVHDKKLLNSQGLYPNRKHTGWWDSNGVAIVETPNCDSANGPIKTGLDHAIGTRPYQPYDNPTVARYEGESYKNKHHSVFDLARGNFISRVLSI
jgi:hypothetical protein